MNKHNIKLAFKTSNRTQRLLNAKGPTNDKYIKTGVYKVTCSDCPSSYIGQTGRSFNTRFKEHHPDPKTIKQKSNVAQHLIDNNHTLNSIDKKLKILHISHKSKLLNTLEEFEIYRATKSNENLLNDKFTVKPNQLFNALIDNNKPHISAGDNKEDRRGGEGGAVT